MPTLFISNIHYDVDYTTLFDILTQLVPFKHLEYVTKVAFVEFGTQEDLNTASALLGGIVLWGRNLVVQETEAPVALLVECAVWCDTAYVATLFRRYGSCKCLRHRPARSTRLSSMKSKLNIQLKQEFRRNSNKAQFVVIFRRKADADRAFQEMNDRDLLGNIIHIMNLSTSAQPQ